MLKGYEEDLANIDFTLPPEELKKALALAANKRAEGLSNKNQELLGKVTSGEGLTAAEKQKLIELEAFKSNSDIQSAKDAQNWQEASDLQKKAWDAEKLTMSESLTSYQNRETVLLIDNALSIELDASDINKDLKAGAIAVLKSGATIVDGKAMIDGKSLRDAVKEWAETPAGKASCLAPNNSGGGAEGGNTPAGGKKFSDMTLTEKTLLLNTDPEKYNLLKG